MCVGTLSQRRKCSLESSSWVDGGVCCAVLGNCMCVHIRWRLEVWICCAQVSDELGENGLVKTKAPNQKRLPYAE